MNNKTHIVHVNSVFTIIEVTFTLHSSVVKAAVRYSYLPVITLVSNTCISVFFPGDILNEQIPVINC